MTSPISNPVTFSVNWKVIGMVARLVGLVALDVMLRPGMVLSKVIVKPAAAASALPAISVAAPAPMLAVTAPLAVGVIVAV